MNKDHVLFLVIGLLGGFLLGYVSHEVMSSRQPAPVQAGAGPAKSGGAQTPPPATQGAPGPAMEQVQQLRAYVEKNPNDAPAVRDLANLNYDISNWQRAAELYEQYLKLVPDDADVMTDLGACLRNMGKFTDALAAFERAVEKAPNHWQARYNQTLVLGLDLGRFDEASAAAEELKKLEPGNPEVDRLIEAIGRRRAAGA